jgi:arabinan endo-1,5-alpha-L-arabinosidase
MNSTIPAKRFFLPGFMKSSRLLSAVSALVALGPALSGLALEGEPYIHDPSTIVACDGKFYTFGTGSGGLISDDGWTWRSGAGRPGGGAAPDVIKLGDRYLVAYGATGGGLGGGHNGRILTMWNKSLDPQSPEFKYTEAVVVASSDGHEDCDAIDPSLFLDPTDGRLWLTYGTYFGFIRLVELDPRTGHRVAGNEVLNVAIDCEATDLIYRAGWYYLLGTHGTCCDGANSTYNIRVGRSRKVTGPFVDNMGIDMLRGGGKLVVAANGRYIGPGHFGRLDLGDGVEKFSCHYEADLERSGRSVLDVRALLWKDGWPVAGENFTGGTFQILSQRKGYALELAVDFVRMAGRMPRAMASGSTNLPTGTNLAGLPPRGTNASGGPGEFGMRGRYSGPVTNVPLQTLEQVSSNWPAGNIEVRLGDYMVRPHQKWAVTPVTGAGGYLGAPYFKITLVGTDRALAATAAAEVVTVSAFTGASEQLWRIEQLTDGTYRIMPKVGSNSGEALALTAVGGSTPSLAKFDPNSDKARWTFEKP